MIDWDSCVLWLDCEYFTEFYWWDRSRYRNDGVIHGAKWKADSFYFDGSDDYADCNNHDSLNINDVISIEALLIPYTTGYIVCKKNYDNWDSAYAVMVNADYQQLYFYGNGASSVYTPSDMITVGEPNHVVVTAENSGTIRFFVNGELVHSDSTPNYSGSGEKCFVGARPHTGQSTMWHIQGYFYFVRIYHTILRSTEIQILATLGRR